MLRSIKNWFKAAFDVFYLPAISFVLFFVLGYKWYGLALLAVLIVAVLVNHFLTRKPKR